MNVIFFESDFNTDGQVEDSELRIDVDYLRKNYAEWEEDVRSLIEVSNPCAGWSQSMILIWYKQVIPNLWSHKLNDVNPLPFFVSGRVALAGDAVSQLTTTSN